MISSPTLRKCKSCEREKPLNNFYCRNGKYKNYYSYCKVCTRRKNLDWYTSNKEHAKQINNAWRNHNYQHFALVTRERNLKNAYGITHAQYMKQVEQQQGLCKICNKKTDISLAVDHNHITGEVRGLLCFNCNAGLGQFKDNLDNVCSAYNYLLEYEAKNAKQA